MGTQRFTSVQPSSASRSLSRWVPRLALAATALGTCSAVLLSSTGHANTAANAQKGAAPEPAKSTRSNPLVAAVSASLGQNRSSASAVVDDKLLAEYTTALAQECERPLAGGNPGGAIKACERFLEHGSLGARAHAASSAAYMMMEPADPRRSAGHAEMAAKLGSPAGKYLWAYHGLNGEAGTYMDPEAARKALEEAKAGGIDKATRLLTVLDKMDACQDESKFRFLNRPSFCLLRPQLDRWLKANGMVPKVSRQAWTDEYNPSAVLPDAISFDVSYDRDNSSSVFYPAAMTYRFPAKEGNELITRVSRSLADKYGTAASGSVPPAPGNSTQWRTAEGVHIEINREPGGEFRVRYAMPQRVQSALQHAAELQARREERLAEQTRKAL